MDFLFHLVVLLVVICVVLNVRKVVEAVAFMCGGAAPYTSVSLGFVPAEGL